MSSLRAWSHQTRRQRRKLPIPCSALLAGAGIGDLPPIVQPQLMRDGRLVEVMPKWHFGKLDLWMVHLGNRYVPRQVRVFKEFAIQMVPTLFPALPI
jgi:DNA-binding transcriptional LysR family regulator